MSILGSLIVELKAETASFIAGMTGASKTARTVGKEIESSFSELGSIAETALAPFGLIGAAVGETLEKIGDAAGGAVASFGKLGGTMGIVAGVSAGAGAAMLAVAGGASALAVHTAESIAKMGELAQSTGVSVEALSGLSFVGKQVGIDTETMAKALGLMAKSVFTAATAAPGAVNAFTRLGVAVRDANGQIRPESDILKDLADKFSNMPDGITKTALAKQALGRAGQELIPVLNLGSQGIQQMLDTAKGLGVVLDEQTVQASEQFKRSMVTLEAAGEGLSIQLTKQLLPALQTVAGFIVDGFKDKTSGLNFIIDAFAYITKVVLATGETLWAVLQQTVVLISGLGGELLATFNAIGAGIEATAKASIGDFSGAKAALKAGYDGLHQETVNFLDNTKRIWGDYAKFTAGIVAPLAPAKEKKSTTPVEVDTKAAPDRRVEAIDKVVSDLRAQADAELALAAASGQSIAAQHLVQAEGKANEIITRLQADADKASGAEKQKLLAIIKQLTPEIRALTAEQQVGKDLAAVNSELQKETQSYERQRAAVVALTAAYRECGPGSTAVLDAGVEAQLGAAKEKVTQAREEFSRLASTAGVSGAALAEAARGVAVANTQLETLRTTITGLDLDKYDQEITKQSAILAAEKPYLDALNSAYLQNAESIRQAQVALNVYNWEQSHPGATPAQIAAITAEYDAQSRVAKDSELAQAAGQFALGRLYDEQVLKLERVKEVLEANGQDTLLIDARIFDAENQLIKQWDDAALKVGTYGDRFKAVMNEIALQGRESGEAISRAFVTAIDSVEGSFAKLLTGGKTNFKQTFTSLAESITKSEIQKGVGAIASQFGIDPSKLGIGGKPDGTESNPLHVVMKGGGQGIQDLSKSADLGGVFGRGGLGSILGLGGAGGPSGSEGTALTDKSLSSGGLEHALARTFSGGGSGSLFGELFKLGGTGLSKLLKGIFSGSSSSLPFTAGALGAPTAVPGVVGAVGSSFGFGSGGLSGLFGGLFADGGDMTPGKWYVAGERGPEIIGPKNAGMTVTPFNKIGGKSAPTVHQTMNFNLSQPVDMFRRSPAQMMSNIHRASSLAYGKS